MAVYEYFCPKCRRAFELMRPMSEFNKPAKCPKCGSKAQKLVSGLASKVGNSIQPPGKPSRKRVAVSASRNKAKTMKTSKRQSKT
jgi:putative FmdB family regulatory protein